MAQVELRVFSGDLWRKRKVLEALCQTVKLVVADVHYGIKELSPGDITLIVPALDLKLSESDADFELEICEGYENWPRTKVGTRAARGKDAQEILDMRAGMISRGVLRAGYEVYAHNIFEVNGDGTAWVQYKPLDEEPASDIEVELDTEGSAT